LSTQTQTILEKIKRGFERGQRFVITTHVNPDGDGLGCEAALAAYLTDAGKDVYIFNSGPLPSNYDYLDPDRKMMIYASEAHRELVLTADYVIVVDISDWERLRNLGRDMREVNIPIICIDHHPPHGKFGDISLIDTKASSTGEIVFDLLTFCGGSLSKFIAEALYTSIVTDTGGFRFSNTTARTFSVASKLIELGADSHDIYRRIYERQSYAKKKLLAYVINNLKFEQSGRVAWFCIPKDLISRLGAKPNDTEGFADFPRAIDGVEVAAMFNELDGERVKVSLRSKGNYVVNGVARKLGGGGHPFAAGILLEGGLQSQIKRVLQELSKLVNTAQ